MGAPRELLRPQAYSLQGLARGR